MKAFLIVEGSDAKTAEWFYARTGWKALDDAKNAGFDELIGFSIVKTFSIETVEHEHV